VLALDGRGVWALVSGSLFMAVVRVLMLQGFARVWYRPRFGIAGVGAAARFGGFITVDRLLTYIYSQGDALIIGKLLGDAILGFYSVGMHLASLPMQKLAALLNEIGFSAFSRLQSEPEELPRQFLKAVRVLALLAFPVFFGISSVAPEIVEIFLGDKWAGAVLPIQVLSLVVPVRFLNLVLPSSLYGIGRAGVSAANSAVACVIMPVAFNTMSPTELRSGEHESRHHERVEGDRELYALDRRVEVGDDLRDRHVHDAAVQHHHELRGP